MKFKMFFLHNLVLSILLSFSTLNWFMIWFLMEFNMYMFIPFIINKTQNKYINNMLYYFLIQFISSNMFIFMIMIMLNNSNFYNTLIIKLIIMFSILIKLGMFPFYMWFVNLMNNINWMNCFFLSTFQKLIPFNLFMNLFFINKLIFMINIMNSIISTIKGLNQTSMKKILSFSSINHMSWMILLIMFLEKMFYAYIFIYTIINFKLMNWLNLNNFNNLNKLMNENNTFLKMMYFSMMLSLGSIPPMMGFIMKWYSLFIIKMNFLLTINFIMLMILSSITIYYYINFMISSLLMFNNKNKYIIKNKKKMNLNTLMFMFMSLFMLMFNNFMN